MNLRPIRNETDYREAIEESERLGDARPGTLERDRLEVLAMLVDVYEREKFPIGPPDPIEAIKFRMEQAGLTRNDLLPIFGTSGRVSEVLNGRRALTIEMIRGLHERFGISYEVLVGRTSKRAVGRAKVATRKLRGEVKAKTRAAAGQRKTGSSARVGAGR